MTRIFGHMVTRNEYDRYLRDSLAWLQSFTDDVHVHDDISTDSTWGYLRNSTKVALSQRPPDESSFGEDESLFRGLAWQAMEMALEPTEDDWILCIDADEFLVGDRPDTDLRSALLEQIRYLADIDANSLTFEVAEVFDLPERDGQIRPMVRVDGYWSEIAACRLVRWRPDGTFTKRREGGGSVPTEWVEPHVVSLELRIMHLGYALAADRRAKYARYRASRGHNPHHVQSITTRPDLAIWNGQIPAFEVPDAS